MFKISEETIEVMRRFSESMSDISKNIGKGLSIFVERLQKIDFQRISENLSLFVQAFEKLPERERQVVDELTKCAWYMNSNTSLHMTGQILNLNKDDPKYIENIDNIMLGDLKEDEEKNYDWILNSFENRKSILEDALEDHKIGRYNCCIPVFLNQIDGITRDLFGINKRNNFFKKVEEWKSDSKGKKTRTGLIYPYTKEIASELSKNIENDEGFLYSFVIYPLEKLSCLCYDSDDIDKHIDSGVIYCNFSRHGIIHGRDISYGTEVNSYKCISILLYLCTLKEMLIDKNEVS
ncbi:hypothetical protein [Clostridium sp. UBA1652]|uniref:hypothetical protein n=1 Tax=Clostridium sp. UBA1652 TaxID=1946348 RepID=UPI00257F0A4B|nr:hypothetical protein [Clostridium sp. UBA1652]